ncbi:type IV pilus twitching motility protein PilT [Hyalangium sp.]|uniref:type IV pilus twitching motility protein PilT n=1 Tax=Hyalangium sp. TaxID=2028555 RepID=UPI002D2C4A7F|nr:type IV pilus twitching motility protein PilT [Hyalangium sp.]HYI01059.1 type IV pilus twitching motility protein PilT [Hyalangium sp.]
MARLDAIIEKLFKDSGQELLIQTGGGVNMRTPTGLLPVLKQNLTTQQILGAIAELLPAEQRTAFPPEGTTAFPYAAPAGQVQVTLELLQGYVKVSLVPFAQLPSPFEEEKLELASPHEMLDLVAQAVDPVLISQDLPDAYELELELSGPGGFNTPIPKAPPAPPAPVSAPVPVLPVAPVARPVAETPAPVPHATLAEVPAVAEPHVPAAPVAPAAPPVRAAPARPLTLAPVPAPTAPAASVAPAAPMGPSTLPPVPVPAAPAAAAAPSTHVPATPLVPAVPTGPVTQPPVLTVAPAAPVLAPVAPGPSVEEVQDPRKLAESQMLALMKAMLARDASDLHLTSETLPHMRIDGDMVAIEDYGVVTHEKLKAMIFSIAPEKNRKQWEEFHDTDFAYETSAARFRVNVFEDRKGIGAVLRQIPNKIRTAEEIGLSRHVLDLCFLTKGLVLVTGPTGSGKSTTLAALIDYVNRHREDHIITVEDPIEFVHRNKSCLVNQREVGVHTHSFKNALRAALREDPDVVLVGEMRDLETIATAIETAETGHLVFGTLHTNTAASTVERIIDQFPADRQPQIRMMLSESLKGVIAQSLCKRIGGGRVAAQEVLLCTGSVSNLIREGKAFQIPSVMQTSRGQGMVTLNDSLLELVKKKVIEPNEALSKSVARSEMRAMLERAGFKVDTPAPGAGSASTPALAEATPPTK